MGLYLGTYHEHPIQTYTFLENDVFGKDRHKRICWFVYLEKEILHIAACMNKGVIERERRWPLCLGTRVVTREESQEAYLNLGRER